MSKAKKKQKAREFDKGRARPLTDAVVGRCCFCLNAARFWVARLGTAPSDERIDEWPACLWCMRVVYQLTNGKAMFYEGSPLERRHSQEAIKEVEEMLGIRE